jgi:hypothetical protein
MIKTNLFWVVQRQLTQSVPTHKSFKKRGVRRQFVLKKPLDHSFILQLTFQTCNFYDIWTIMRFITKTKLTETCLAGRLMWLWSLTDSAVAACQFTAAWETMSNEMVPKIGFGHLLKYPVTKVGVLRDSHYLFLTPYRIFEWFFGAKKKKNCASRFEA